MSQQKAVPISGACNVVRTPPEKSSRPADAAAKAHHPKPGKAAFRNPWPSWQEIPPDALKAHVMQSVPVHDGIDKFPIRKPDLARDRLVPHDAGCLHATWLGHACYFVEYPSGLRVLFDPVLTDRCSPSAWIGPRRFTASPCQISDLPFVDIVVISHNHYDHLSYPTVREIRVHHPNAHFFVPLGNAAWFASSGLHNVTEMDWWEQASVSVPTGHDGDRGRPLSATVSCLPAQHTTGRGPFGTDKTLWASWGVASDEASVFFGGDTGYRFVPWLKDDQDHDWDDEYAMLPRCPAFAQIGDLRGPFTLGLLPIGAYEPRALMSSIHANPRDAVEIQRDTRCGRALAMHWGTWVLGDEPVQEPPRKLAEALVALGLPERGLFDVCDIGERVSIPLAG
ncbi:uncharacterized protein J7T54_008336 [Emericellopsis cladophorae]|uniref:Metallo-beta-lactamase domain-containing protein n=1 Tax=Emericellopsis cladophorae TaxID=2686198 RepID=A0A9P9Y366_9HYPO|nr:uncharacterized protein J7T54_008336 [Emericellopsis cladophorae]KAI6782250.1 hypothetical protein J7T54_008336 [Emericellopsis cladophorae]